MKTSDLTGALLDYWVAMAADKSVCIFEGGCYLENGLDSYSPSTNWVDGGPIVEENSIQLSNHAQGGQRALSEWSAKMIGSSRIIFGATPLIAAMRCFVARKYGDEVLDKLTL